MHDPAEGAGIAPASGQVPAVAAAAASGAAATASGLGRVCMKPAVEFLIVQSTLLYTVPRSAPAAMILGRVMAGHSLAVLPTILGMLVSVHELCTVPRASSHAGQTFATIARMCSVDHSSLCTGVLATFSMRQPTPTLARAAAEQSATAVMTHFSMARPCSAVGGDDDSLRAHVHRLRGGPQTGGQLVNVQSILNTNKGLQNCLWRHQGHRCPRAGGGSTGPRTCQGNICGRLSVNVPASPTKRRLGPFSHTTPGSVHCRAGSGPGTHKTDSISGQVQSSLCRLAARGIKIVDRQMKRAERTT
eukprot:gene4820-biopygen13059